MTQSSPARRPKRWFAMLLALAVFFGAGFAALEPPDRDVLPEWARYLGRLHLVVLHVPIGGLCSVILLELLHLVRPRAGFERAAGQVLGFTALASLPTFVAGLVLATEGGNAGSALDQHRWAAAGSVILIWGLWAVRPRVSRWVYLPGLLATGAVLGLAGHLGGVLTHGSGYLERMWTPPAEPRVEPVALVNADAHALVEAFAGVRPVLEQHCFVCHGPDLQKGKLRFDTLNPDLVAGPDAPHWREALHRLQVGEMPPPEEPQPSDDERRALVAWLSGELGRAAEARAGERGPVLRRLTRAQITFAMQNLLGVPLDFGRGLPSDGKSARGFTNDGDVLQASSLHLDLLADIAEEALGQAIVVGERPPGVRYSIVFGEGVGRGHIGAEIGGYQALPLSSDDFRIDVLDAAGQVIGGDVEELDERREHIGVGLRGSSGDRFHMEREGIVLLGALPHRELAPGAWQGPSPNLKVELQRVFPDSGELRMRVVASRGRLQRGREQLFVPLDESVPLARWNLELSVPEGAQVIDASEAELRSNLELADGVVTPVSLTEDSSAELLVRVKRDGYYELDLVHPAASAEAMTSIRVSASGATLDSRPEPPVVLEGGSLEDLAGVPQVSALGAAWLTAGEHRVGLGGPFFAGFSHLVVTELPASHPLVVRLTSEASAQEAAVADELPALQALAGTRTDDGMDYREFGPSVPVTAGFGRPQTYEFSSRLEDLPIPEPESGDNEILSGILLLGVWNDHLVKRSDDSGPPLMVHSIELEAPYYEAWPPASHRAILFDEQRSADDPVYIAEVLKRFLGRAFRRPAEPEEVEQYLALWSSLLPDSEHPEEALRSTLAAALSSPHFLFLVEPPVGTGADATIGEHALAARLSMFLTNGPPDARLRALADAGELRGALLTEVERLLDGPRAERFVRAFTTEWLRLDRFEGMTVDPRRYADHTRFVKADLAEETYATVALALREDWSLLKLIQNDVVVINQNLAEYYGIEGVEGQEFRPVRLEPGNERGGLLTQGSFLAGHSDGLDAHPIKRAVWVKDRLLGEPPPPPPPNVPELDTESPEAEGLTLTEQLVLHRSKSACMDCHASLDPFGLVFERFDASGRRIVRHDGAAVDASTVLPDGTAIDGVAGLQGYLLEQRRDDVARALIEHLYAYALGRGLDLADSVHVQETLGVARLSGYRLRSLVRSIVMSQAFQRP